MGDDASPGEIKAGLLSRVPAARQDKLASFLATMLKVYRELHFVYAEINPIVVDGAGASECGRRGSRRVTRARHPRA